MNFTRYYRVAKVGTSQGILGEDFSKFFVHIPAEWAREQGIRKGDVLEVHVQGNRLIVKTRKEDEQN